MTGLTAILHGTLPKGRFVRSVLALATGSAAAQALMMLAMPALTRLYEPVAFGLLASFLALFSVLGILGGLGYDRAIPLPEDDRDAAALTVVSLGTTIAWSAVVAVGIAAYGDALAAWMGAPALASVFWLLPLAIAIGGAAQNLSNWALRTKNVGVVARANVAQSSGMVVGQLGLGLISATPVGLVVGDVLGRACKVAGLVGPAWPEARAAFRAVRPADLGRVARQYKKFTLMVVPGLMGAANSQAPLFVIGAYFGPAALAQYALAQRILATPLGMLQVAISQALVAETAVDGVRNAPRSLALLRKVTRDAGLFALAATVATVVAAPALFTVVFGGAWQQAGEIAPWIVPALVAQFVVSPVAVALHLLERQEVMVARELLRSAFLAAGIGVALHLGGGLEAMLVALCVAGVAGTIVYGALGWRTVLVTWAPAADPMRKGGTL